MVISSRRSIIKQASLAGALSCTGVSILAQSDDVEREKAPYKKLNVPKDSRSIAIFFDFSCNYCAEYHPALVRWADTVPRTVKVTHYPVVNIDDQASLPEQILSAQCFYAASNLASATQLKVFAEVVYEARTKFVDLVKSGASVNSNKGVTSPLKNPKMWLAAANAAGINQTSFLSLIRSESSMRLVKASATKLIEYNVRETPSVGIGGRYMLTPRHANGSTEMFFNLLNGFVTEIV